MTNNFNNSNNISLYYLILMEKVQQENNIFNRNLFKNKYYSILSMLLVLRFLLQKKYVDYSMSKHNN